MCVRVCVTGCAFVCFEVGEENQLGSNRALAQTHTRRVLLLFFVLFLLGEKEERNENGNGTSCAGEHNPGIDGTTAFI